MAGSDESAALHGFTSAECMFVQIRICRHGRNIGKRKKGMGEARGCRNLGRPIGQ